MKRFTLLLVLALVLSAAAENVTVIETVDVPASAPLVDDALSVLGSALSNASVPDVPGRVLEVVQTPDNLSELVVEFTTENTGIVEQPVGLLNDSDAVPVTNYSVEPLDAVNESEQPDDVPQTTNYTLPTTNYSVPPTTYYLLPTIYNLPPTVEVVETVDVPAVAPYVEDALDAMVDQLQNASPVVPVEPPVNNTVNNSLRGELVAINDSILVNESVELVLNGSAQVNALANVSAVFVVRDASGRGVSGSVKFLERGTGRLLAQKAMGVGTSSAVEVPRSVDVLVDLDSGPVSSIEFEDVNLSGSEVLRVDDTPESGRFVQMYAIDPVGVNFSTATVTVVAQGTALLKCKQWDFDSRSCAGSWSVFKSGLIPGREYSFELTPEDPGFGEINATAAIHLDKNGSFVSDVFSQVNAIDGVWSEPIPAGHKVRVTFERNLTNGSVIDFLARDNGTVSYVEIYVANTSVIVGRSGIAGIAEVQYVKLGGVPFGTDVFDLKVVKLVRNITNDNCDATEPDCNANTFAENALSGFIEFDFIHDAAVTAAGSDGLAAYAEASVPAPRYRFWNLSNQSFMQEQTDANSVGADIEWLVLRPGPRFDKFVMGTLDINTNTSVQVYESNWSDFQALAFDNPNTGRRGFDLDFEQISGDALIVYEDSIVANGQVKYRLYNGTGWSSEFALNTNVTAAVHWVKTVGRNGSDDVMVLLEDANLDIFAVMWNGTGFDNATQMNITGSVNDIAEQLFDFIWEGSSKDGLVVYANSTTTYAFRTFNYSAKSWSADQVFFTLDSGAPNGMRLCGDKKSDRIGFVSQDTTGDGNFRMWNGSAVETSPVPPAEDAAIEANGAGAVSLDCAFESQSNNGLFGYIPGLPGADNDARVCSYNSSSWSHSSMINCPLTGSLIGGGNSVETLEFYPHPVTNEIMMLGFSFVENLASARWNGSNWTNVSTIETALDCLNGQTQCAMFAWGSFDPAPSILVVSPANGSIFTTNGTVNFTVNATDNINISRVNVSVTLPNGSIVSFNLTLVSGTTTSGLYELNFTNTTQNGQYNFTVFALDSSGASSSVSGSFTISGALFTNVTVAKSDSPDPVVRGQTLRYQINVSNAGTIVAENVTVRETYPTNVVFNGSQPAPSSGNNTFTIGNLSAGRSFLVNITVNVSASNGSLLNNTAVVNYSNSTGNQSVNTSILTTVLGFPVVFADKADTPDPVLNGSTLRYQITVFNTGDEIAYNVTVVDGYPANVIFNGSQPSPASGNGTFSLGNLLPGQSTTINITVNVSAALANGSVLNNSFNATFANISGVNTTVPNSTITTVQGAALVFTSKSDSPDPVPKGTTLRYQIVVNNVGTEIAYNVTVVDGYPANVIFNGSQPSPSSGNGTFSLGNLLPGVSTTVNITVNVSAGLTNNSVLNNSYNVTFASLAGQNSTVSNSTLTTVLGSPVVVSVKSDSPDPVVKGQQLNYSILINNTGDDTAFNVTLVETYPAGVVFHSSGPVPISGNGTFSLGNLSPNASTTVNITVNVSNGLSNGTVLTNTVNATFANSSGQNGSASDSELTTVLGFPVVFASKSDSPDPVPKGTTLRYQITVVNLGDEFAYNVSVVDGYPVSVVFNGSQPVPTSGNNTFSLGNLSPGQSTTVNITVNVSSALTNSTVLNNSFNATFANLSGVNTTVTNSTTTAVLGSPVIVNIKSDSPDPVVKGQQLNYSILINNTGDDTAFNVTVVETYPAGVVFHNSSPVASSGNGTFLLGNISNGSSTTINITVNVSNGLANGTVLTNVVNATFANSSGQNSSVVDSELTTVLGFPVVFASKSDSPDPVLNGSVLSYQITVINLGDEFAYNVTVVDSYPSNVVFNGSQPSPSSGNNTFSLGNLSAGQSATVNITVNVSGALANGSVLNNSFNATFANVSGVNTTVTNSTTTNVQGTPIVITIKNDNPDPVIKGQQLNYSIFVNNTGGEIAYNVTVVESYPSGVVFHSSTPAPSSGNNTFGFSTLLPGQSTTINITVNVSNGLTNGSVLNNSVSATFANASGQNVTVSDSELTTVLGFAQVSVNKSDSPDPVVRGATLRYQIVVNNTGDEIAYNITVFEDYPVSVVFNGSQPVPSSGNNTFLLGNLTNGTFTTINITLNIGRGLANGTVINNTVNVTFANLSGVNFTQNASQNTTVIADTIQPLVFDVRPFEGTAFAPGIVIEISANVTDNIAVDNVTANITFPNGTTFLVNLTRVPGTDKYNGSFITPNLNGQYNITFRANDTEGNINNTVVTSFNVGLDTIVPQIRFVGPTPADNTFTGNTFVPVNISVDEANMSVALIELNGSRVNFTTPLRSEANGTDITFVASLTSQSHVITIADNASRANLTATFSVISGTLNVLVNGNNVGTIGTSDVSPKTFENASNFLLIGSNTIEYAPVIAVTATIDQSNITYTPLNMSFFNNFTGLADGVYQYFGSVSDIGSNSNQTGNRTITIDTLRPAAEFVSPTDANGSTIARRNILVNLTGTDVNFANTTIRLFNSTGGEINSSNTSSSPNFVNFTGLADGLYFFNATVFDLAGNINNTETRQVVVKVNPPNVSVLSPVAGGSFLLNDTINITANVTDWLGVGTVMVQITYPDGTLQNFSTNVTGSLYNLSFSNLTQRGNYTIRIFANDTLNNVNNSFTLTFIRQSLNVIDIVNRTGGFVNYTLSVTSNVSGMLNLSANISGSRVKSISMLLHNSSSILSILRIDDPFSESQTPNGSFVEYAIDPTGINFTNASVVVTAIGDYLLYTCKNYNFSGQECLGNWSEIMNISPGQNYTITITPNDPGFLETSSAVDVAIAPVNNTAFVIAFVDNNESDVSFRIMNTNGTVIVNTTDVDTSADNVSRVDVALVNSTHFLISWVDGPSDDLTQGLFLINGTNTTSPTVVRAGIGLNTDVKLASIVNQSVTCYANDGNADASFLTFFNNGTQSVGELAVDGNMAPAAPNENLVGCAGANSTRWAYFWFDDLSNDATFSIQSETGALLTGQVDIDADVGETGQVAMTSLGNSSLVNNSFFMAFYDSVDQNVYIAGRTSDNVVLFAPASIDGNAGVISRISAGTVKMNETSSEDVAVVAWWDENAGAIKAATFNASGSNISNEITVESQPNSTFRLLDVAGRVSVTNNSICPGRFVVAYTNSSGQGVFKGFFTDGSSWDGTCDLVTPLVFDLRPVVNSTFNIGETIELAANVTDDGVIDTVLANVTLPNGTIQQVVLVIVPGTSKYNASFFIPLTGLYNVTIIANDTSGRVNSSEVTNFTALFVTPSISTSKTDSPDPVVKGQQLNYSILINNTGNSTAFNVTVVESYPSGVLFHSSSPVASSGNGTFSVGNLSPNMSTTVNITVNVSLGLVNGTVLNNSYNVTFANASGQNATVTNSTLTSVLGAPVVVTIKTDSPDPVVKGQQLNYSILINNTGDDTAFNLTFLDSYPSGVVFHNSSPVPTVGNNTFSLGNLSPNASTTVNITVNVSNGLANGTLLNNTANASFQNTFGLNQSASDTEQTTVVGFPVVFTSKSDAPDPVARGEQLQYSIVVSNLGDEIAYNVTVVENYPENVTFHNSSPAPSVGNNTFSLGNLSPGQSATVNITLNVSAAAANGSVLNNSYNVTFANVSGVNTTVRNSTTTTVLGAATISVVKVDSPDPVIKGQQVNYSILVNNTGDDVAFNVTLTETYPSGVVFHNSSPVPTVGNNTFSLGNLSPNASTTVNITVNVSNGLANGTLLSNFVNVSFQNTSGGNRSSSDTEVTTVTGFAVVFTSKSDSPDPVPVNSTLRYQIMVNNVGDDIAYNVTVVEGYPVNVTFNGSQPLPSSGNGTFSVGNILPGGSTTINITVNVSFAAFNGSLLNNSYNVSFANATGQNFTVTNSTTTTIAGIVALAVSKSDSVDPVLQGSQLNYTITVQNLDGEIAYNVTVNETYPSGVLFVSSSPAPASGNSTFSLGNLSPGASVNLSILVNVSNGIANGTVLNNSVNVSAVSVSGEFVQVNATESTTVISGLSPVVVSIAPANGTNTTNLTVLFFANVTDAESATLNCSLLLNGSVNQTNSSVLNNSVVNFTVSGLSEGNYTWAVACTDTSADTSTSETRVFAVDRTPPDFLSLLFSPSTVDALDPGVLINFTANITDNFTAVDLNSVVLHIVVNGSSFANVSMSFNVLTGEFNASFLAVEGSYIVFMTGNDTAGNNGTSGIVVFNVSFEATWTRSPANLGVFSSPMGVNISMGNITINNTGDVNLSFVLNSTLNATFFSETNFTLSPGGVRMVGVNATAPGTVGVFSNNITINATTVGSSLNASPAQLNTSFTITTVDDAFLFADFSVIPSQVQRGQSGISIIARVTNRGTKNASNVTLNITLPVDWVLTGGGLSTFFGTIEPNASEELPIIVQIPSGAVLGFRDVSTAADGFNDSGVLLSSQNLTLGTTAQVLVVAGPGFVVGGGGSGSGGGAGGAGGAGGGGGGIDPGTFQKTFFERAALVTNETIEVKRGTRIVFPLIVTNVYNNSLMKRVDLTVDGYLSRYIHWSPQALENIPYGQSRIFDIELAAPAYEQQSEVNITFIMTSLLEAEGVEFRNGLPFSTKIRKTVVEYKRVRLIIREVTSDEVERAYTDVESLYAIVVAKDYPVTRADVLRGMLRNALVQRDYKESAYVVEKLRLLLERELEAGALLDKVRTEINKAEDEGLDVLAVEKLLSLAVKAFEREDFDRAISLADEALAVQLRVVERAWTWQSVARRYWWALALLAALALYGALKAVLLARLAFIKYRLDALLRERVEAQRLLREAQEAYFVRRELGGREFERASGQLQLRLERITGDMVGLRLLRSRLYRKDQALKVAIAERQEAMRGLREAQLAYFAHHVISRRRYELRMQVFKSLVTELDAHIAELRKEVGK